MLEPKHILPDLPGFQEAPSCEVILLHLIKHLAHAKERQRSIRIGEGQPRSISKLPAVIKDLKRVL